MVRRWLVALVTILTALTGSVLGVSAAPAGAAAHPNSRPPVVTNMWDSDGAVVVGFKDRSVDEDAFQLFRRGLTGFWEYVVEAPTPDKPGQKEQNALVDHSPNPLRCYAVVAYDYAGSIDNLWSRPECVGGGSDPYEVMPGVTVAAPRVASVRREAGSQVRITYVDRSRNESRFKLFRRQRQTSVLVVESEPASRTGVGRSQAFLDTIPTGTDACYSVQAVDDTTSASNYSNEVCLTPPSPLPAPPRGNASVTSVYTGPRTAGPSHFTGTSSVAIGTDGLPVISFVGQSRATPEVAQLMVAHCGDAACTDPVRTELADVDPTASWPHAGTSIAIGRDGLPLVTFAREAGGVGVAHCVNQRCTDATVTTLDTPARLALGTAHLDIGPDGLPTIAYADRGGSGPSKIKVAHCATADCTRATVTVVDTVPHRPGFGGPVAFATSRFTGNTYVAYAADIHVGATPQNVVKVATCFDPACTHRSISTVDRGHLGESSTGDNVSIAIGRDDLPLLSYQAHDDLVVAHCVNVFCTDVTTTVVDEPAAGSDPGTVSGTRVAVGTDGLGVVVYQGRDLRVVHCADLACQGTHAVQTVSRHPLVFRPSITMDAGGRPVVTYDDGRTVRMLRCPDAACSGGPLSPPDPVGPVMGGGKCAEVLLASTANGTPIQLRPCSGHVAQSWRVGADRTLRALGKCLDITAAGTADGTPIQLYDCNGHWAQVWEPQPDGTLRNPVSGKCLDTALHSDVDFIRLVLWGCNSNIRSQIWEPPVA